MKRALGVGVSTDSRLGEHGAFAAEPDEEEHDDEAALWKSPALQAAASRRTIDAQIIGTEPRREQAIRRGLAEGLEGLDAAY